MKNRANLLLAAALVASATQALAADRIKQNNTTALNLAGSWDTLPGTGDIAVWNSTVTGANSVALGADLSWAGIKIVNPGGAVTITHTTGQTLTLGASGIDMSAATQNLNLLTSDAAVNLAIGANQVWNVASSRTLTLFESDNAKNERLTGSANIEVTGGGIVRLLTGDAGSTTFAAGNGNDTYTGNWTITSGSVRGLRNGTHAWGQGTITLNGGTIGQEQGSWTWTNNFILNTSTTSYFDDYNSSGTTRSLKLQGVISGDGNLTFKDSSSRMGIENGYILTGTNTLSGTVTIDSGADVRVGGVGGNDTSVVVGSTGTLGTATIVNNGNLTLSRDNTWTFNNNMSGTGLLRIGLTTGSATHIVTVSGNNTHSGGTTLQSAVTLKIGSANALGTGTVTIAGNGIFDNATGTPLTVANALTLSGGSPTFTGTNDMTINGAVTLSGANRTITVSGGSLSLGGAISGAFNLTKQGAGTLVLNGASTGYANAIMAADGTLKLGNASALGTTAAGTTVTTGGALDLNGQTIGAEALTLNGTGISSGGALINGSGTAASHTGTIALGSSSSVGGSGDATLSGVISGVGFGLTKVGSGTVTLDNTNSYSGNTTISLGTLALGTSGSIANTPTITVTSGAVFDVSASSFALGGSQTLNAGRTSGFATDVNGNFASGGTINPGANGTKGTLTISGGLSLTGGNMNFDLTGGTFTAGSGVNDLIAASGALNLSGTTTVNASWTGSPVTGSYTLIAGGSLGSGGTANLVKGTGLTDGARIAFAFDTTSTAGTVFLNVTGGPAALTWVGDGGANAWDIGTTANWDNGGSPDNFYDLDNVTFDDSSSNGAVSLGVTATPGSVVVDNSTTAYTLSGAGKISGSGGLTKTGTNTLTLSTTSGNDYTGGTLLRQGTIVATTTNGLGSGGTITINDAGTGANNTTLNVDATSGSVTIANAITVANQGSGTVTIGTVTASGSNQSLYSGVIALAKGVTILNGAAGDRLQFSGGITGTGDVTVDGISNTVKTVLIGAANTFSGNVYITGNGRLQLSDGSATATSLLPDSASVNLNTSGGVFNLAKGGNNETIDALNGVAGTSVNAVSGSDTLTLGSNGGSGSFAGNITGSLTLTKTGAGTQSLSGTNTYTGATTTISGGTLAISGGSAIPDAGTVSIANTAKLQVNASETISTLTTVAGSTVEVTSGTLTFTNGSMVGNLTGSGTVLRNGTSDTATSQFTATDALNFNGTLQLRGSTPSTSPSNMQGGTGRFWLNSSGGTQAAGTAFALDTGASATNAQDFIIGEWDATSGNRKLTLSSLTGYGAIRTDAGGAGVRNLIVDQSGGDTTFNGMLLSHRSGAGVDREIAFEKKGTSTLVMAGIVGSQTASASGTAALTITVSGGTLELNAANTYTGATIVNNGGTLKLGNASALGVTTAGTTVNSGGMLDLNGQTIGAEALTLAGTGISGSGALINSSATAASLGGGVTLAADTTIAADNAITLSGSITESSAGLGITKIGSSTLTLSGSSGYTGTTAIDAGTLLANNTSGSATGTGAVTVASGATLGGTGTLTGAVTVTGKMAPGAGGIGTLGTGAVTWKGASTAGASTNWEFALGSANAADKLNITGDFTKDTSLGSIFNFDFLGSTFTGIFTLAQWSGSTTFAATDFSYSNLGAASGTFTINGLTNELQFTAVPEPTSALAGLLVGAGLLRRRRREEKC